MRKSFVGFLCAAIFALGMVVPTLAEARPEFSQVQYSYPP